MKKRIVTILIMGVMIMSFMTACKSSTTSKVTQKESNSQEDVKQVKEENDTEKTKEAKEIEETKETEEVSESDLSEQDTTNQEINQNTSRDTFLDWEDAYKDVLLNPQKYDVSLMDSTTPDDGWKNLGFTIIDLDGDNTPELLVYYNDGSNTSAADVLAFTNGNVQNIANVWTQGAFKPEKGSFLTMDNGGLYGSSFTHRFAKTKDGLYKQIKSFDYIDDQGAEQKIYKEDGTEIAKEQFLADRTANDMDNTEDCIESAGTHYVQDENLNVNTTKETMDGFITQ